MKTKMMAVALTSVALLVAACGDDDDSGESNGSTHGGSSTVSAGTAVDRAFVAAMVPHHRSAIEMAEIARKRGESEFVKSLAANIIRTQEDEIATLRQEDAGLEESGVKPGDLGVDEHAMGMEDDPAKLNDAKPFDEAFIKMMIPHHEGAVTMAQAELEKGKDPELRKLAKQIIAAQEGEITAMREHIGDDSSGSEETDEHGEGHMG